MTRNASGTRRKRSTVFTFCPPREAVSAAMTMSVNTPTAMLSHMRHTISTASENHIFGTGSAILRRDM